jgi:hypothetical protein
MFVVTKKRGRVLSSNVAKAREEEEEEDCEYPRDE